MWQLSSAIWPMVKKIARPLAVAFTLAFLTTTMSAQTEIIAWNPTTTNIMSVLPYIDGVAFPVTWASIDSTTCTASTCTALTYSFTALENLLTNYISGGMYSTCGKALPGRGGGHLCIIDLDVRPVTNMSSNLDTPSYVFTTGWASASNPVDAVFCTSGNYNGSSYMLNAPPSNDYANVNGTCSGGSITPACYQQTVATGIPAIWETPYETAILAFWTEFVSWASGNVLPTAPVSQIGYVRFGFSIGSEATINCTKYLEEALGNFHSTGTQATDSQMKAAWLGAYASAASNILAAVAAQPIRPPWVPMMTVNMGTSLPGTFGNTDPSWAIGEAQILLQNQPFGIGTQGLENGAPNLGPVASDLTAIANGISCNGSSIPCCSDNWCNTRSMVIGNVPVIELQDCNVSDSASTSATPPHCLDSVLAGTIPAGQDQVTLSQIFPLSSQHATTSAEIYYNDLLCAFDPGSTVLSGTTCGNVLNRLTYSAAYANAILALAAGQPSGTSTLIGNAQMIGNATLF